jgi:hypothetical protein
MVLDLATFCYDRAFRGSKRRSRVVGVRFTMLYTCAFVAYLQHCWYSRRSSVGTMASGSRLPLTMRLRPFQLSLRHVPAATTMPASSPAWVLAWRTLRAIYVC